MSKRVFIVHGWGADPNSDWFPWLKGELEQRGFKVAVPAMPDTEKPVIEAWVSELRKQVGTPDSDTYLVGHSIGCQTIQRYLASDPTAPVIGGALFVSGWFTLQNMEEGEEPIARPWFDTPIDFAAVRRRLPKSIAIFSDNDPVVPIENRELFAERLGSEVITEHERGHFNASEGVTELPAALEAIVKLAA